LSNSKGELGVAVEQCLPRASLGRYAILAMDHPHSQPDVLEAGAIQVTDMDV